VKRLASEPAVSDPIDIAWGSDGRMWVVEMADYPSGIDGKGKPGGRVRVLESTQRDGRYDKSTLFADGLKFPTSAVPWRDGVLVTAAPDILFLQDTDGDGRADRTTKLFTNLGEGNPQHMANGLQWGLDGWLHLANGGTRGDIASAKTGRSVEMGRDVRIKPDEGLAEPQTGRSQFGRNRDEWGSWFGNNNVNPIWHYALEDHYVRRNPFLVPPNAIVLVPESGSAPRVFPTSETLARFNSPGGANHITSACSPFVYRDDFLGAGYEGNVFVSENVHNLVYRQVLTPTGATFRSRRAPGEEQSEFLASSDNWVRFTSTRGGPDGALYVVDMYRLVIEHPQYIPAEWMRELGEERLRAGFKQGRIFRVMPQDKPLRTVPRLDTAENAAVVAALESPSGTLRDLAMQQLVWRGARRVAPVLEALLGHARPQTRVQALCTLDLLGGLTPAAVGRALRDPHPGVRRQAVRLTEQFAGRAPELLDHVIALAADADAFVRQQVAYSLGEWKGPAAAAALALLLGKSEDRFVVAAALSSAVPHAASLIAQLDLEAGFDRSLIEMATAPEQDALLLPLLQAIGAPRAGTSRAAQFGATAQLLDVLARKQRSLETLDRDRPPEWSAAIERLHAVVVAGRAAAAAGTSPAERTAAAGLLGREPAAQGRDLDVVVELLHPRHPTELQLAAVRALARFSADAVPGRVLDAWAALGPQARTALLEVLSRRPAWALALLERLEQDRAMLAQIDIVQRTGFTEHNNARVAERAAQVFQSSIDPNRSKVIDDYIAAAQSATGDRTRGAEVFKMACAACHKFGAVAGGVSGPDLAGLADRSAQYIITHVLDPNRVVDGRYVLYLATRQDGQALAGMVASESGNSLTLLGVDGREQVVMRSELKSLESTGRSLMPDGLEAAITPAAMADLVMFLAEGNVVLPRARPPRKKR
jgi:putative membrane-bound dehydrogenase-like protein